MNISRKAAKTQKHTKDTEFFNNSLFQGSTLEHLFNVPRQSLGTRF
jgi:hypothetical protein